MNLLKRIGLPTPPLGKILRGVAASLGIGATAVFSGVDTAYALWIVAGVLALWISGDLQVAKEFLHIIKPEKK